MTEAIGRLRQKIADWLTHQRTIRRRKLNVVPLEDRRLPDASFGLTLGVLTLDGFDGSDSLKVELDASTDQLHFSLSEGKWDAYDLADPAFQLSANGMILSVDSKSLSELRIDATDCATGGLASLEITGSPAGITVSQLTITGAGSVVLDSTANDISRLTISAESLELFDNHDLSIHGLNLTGSLDLTSSGAITNDPGATVSIGGHAQIVGAELVLGNHDTDTIEFSSLTMSVSGMANVSCHGNLELSGSSGADSLELHISGDLTDAEATELKVSGHANISANSVQLGDDVTDSIHFGSLTFHAIGDVSVSEADDTELTGTNTADSLVLVSA